MSQIKAKKALEAARKDFVGKDQARARLLERARELWLTELNEGNKGKIREAIRQVLNGGRILVDLGSAKQNRPLVVTIPAAGGVDELHYTPQARSLCLQQAVLQIAAIELQELG